jgi:peptidase M23-like protein
VYELHVTNFGPGALGFRALEIRSRGQKAAMLASYVGDSLAALLEPAGASSTHDATRLPPGQCTIIFLWLALPISDARPDSLQHHLLFDNLDSALAQRDGGSQSAVDVTIPVSRESPSLLSPPLPQGTWAIAGPSNTSDHRRTVAAVAGHARDAERFAIDALKVGPNGNTFQGDEHRNESYWAFGEPALAVASGEVVAAVDSIADHEPHGAIPRVTLANIFGNYVTLRIAPHRFATYAHLRRGSVRVRPGARVTAGQVLGSIGNTGQTTAPHLHFQLTNAAPRLDAEGLPFELRSFSFLGTAADFDPSSHHVEQRRHEIPLDATVIALP